MNSSESKRCSRNGKQSTVCRVHCLSKWREVRLLQEQSDLGLNCLHLVKPLITNIKLCNHYVNISMLIKLCNILVIHFYILFMDLILRNKLILCLSILLQVPHFYYILGANLVSFLLGDVSISIQEYYRSEKYQCTNVLPNLVKILFFFQ